MIKIDFDSKRGQLFGNLTFVKHVRYDGRRHYVAVKCSCGMEAISEWENLKKGRTKSCGCKRFPERELGTRHPMYKMWTGVKQRCYNPKNISYPYYGAKGIKVCERWLVYRNFYLDNIDQYKNGLQLDRFPDKRGDYSPENTRWVTQTKNNRNTTRVKMNEENAAIIRNSKEQTMILASKYGVSKDSIRQIRNGRRWNPNIA